MTKRWSSSCSGAVSSIRALQNVGAAGRLSLNVPRQHPRLAFALARSFSNTCARHDRSPPTALAEQQQQRPEKAALFAVQNSSSHALDRLNPPLSTLPPPLKLPESGKGNKLVYFLRLGKAYGGFYWMGLKAVWFNNKAARVLQQRVKEEAHSSSGSSAQLPAHLRGITRAEFQLLARNSYDIGKLPFFGLLVCLLGEWLPLIVPFVPGIVPGTCRIPKQVKGMLAKAEERRRTSFRQGTREPPLVTLWLARSTIASSNTNPWPTAISEPPSPHTASLLASLLPAQLHHLSSTLNLHAKAWDWINLTPPAALLRRAIAKRLAYLSSDDYLLLRDGAPTSTASEKNSSSPSPEILTRTVAKLTPDELHIACSQRGIDVLGRRDDLLRTHLAAWLTRQHADDGRGQALLLMLFRRPNAWDTKT